MGITDIPYHMVFKWLFAKLIFCRFFILYWNQSKILFGRTLLIFNWFCMITLGCTLKSKIISLFVLGCPYSNLLNHLSKTKSLQNRHFYQTFFGHVIWIKNCGHPNHSTLNGWIVNYCSRSEELVVSVKVLSSVRNHCFDYMTVKIFVQESLAKSDSILIQKYVNLYKQVTALKQELKQPPIPPTPVEITPTQKIKQVGFKLFSGDPGWRLIELKIRMTRMCYESDYNFYFRIWFYPDQMRKRKSMLLNEKIFLVLVLQFHQIHPNVYRIWNFECQADHKAIITSAHRTESNRI